MAKLQKIYIQHGPSKRGNSEGGGEGRMLGVGHIASVSPLNCITSEIVRGYERNAKC